MAESLGARGLPRAVVDDVYLAPVHLNVGGTTYTTTLTTLTKFPDSKLAKLFNGTLAITLDPINRHYFLDVDGSVFTHILNFLRYEKLVLPDDFNQLPLLKQQVEFFELGAMLAALTNEVETNEESETEEDNVKQRQRRKRRRKTGERDIDNEELGGEEEEAVTGQGEEETGGGSEVVVMDTNGYYTISLYSSAELSLQEPLPEYKNLKPGTAIRNSVHYNLSNISYDNLPGPYYFNPCLVHFTKQLLDKGYKLTAAARTAKESDSNKYIFTRVK